LWLGILKVQNGETKLIREVSLVSLVFLAAGQITAISLADGTKSVLIKDLKGPLPVTGGGPVKDKGTSAAGLRCPVWRLPQIIPEMIDLVLRHLEDVVGRRARLGPEPLGEMVRPRSDPGPVVKGPLLQEARNGSLS